MFKEEFKELNKNPELEPICNIRMMDIYKYCVDEPEVMLDNFRKLRNSYRSRINYLLNYNKLNDDFFTTLKIYGDSDHFIGLFKLNKDEYIKKLQKYLNTETNSCDYNDKEITRILEEKVNKLSKITNIDELKKEFPEIAKDYEKGLEMHRQISIIDFLDPKAEENREQLNELYNLKRYYYNCGLRFHFPYFIEEQTKLYKSFIKNKDKVANYCEHSSLSHQMFDGINEEKLELLLCNNYLDKIDKSNNLEEIFMLVKMCEEYFIKTVHTDKVINMDNGKVISYKNLVKRYKQVLREYNIESKCFVNWEILPEGEDLDKVHIKSEPRVFRELSEEEINKLRKANQRKINFFNESYYLGRALGDSYFRGYIAFFYPNGEVLMDTLADENNLKSAIGDAMYNVSIYDFVELSKLDKKTLRSTGKAKKIVHRGNWEERAKAIISTPADEKSIEDTKKLIKSLK